jgi:hypothetical protein
MDGKLLKNYTKACRSCFFVNFEETKYPPLLLFRVGWWNEGKRREDHLFFFIFFLFSLKPRLRFDLGVVWVNISEGKLYINLFGKKSRDQISRNRETINLKRKGEESCKKILILFQVQVSG